MIQLDSRIPSGDIETAWDRARFEMKLVNPANKRKYSVIVVGSGLAGASAAATLGELGYNVKCFCFQDSPRRAHSIAAQGGINAAKNYQNDGDSIYRLFYDTVKGGDFRAREAQRLPPGADQRQHHRPVRRPGRALCARIRRHACRTAPSAAPRSRERSTPGARRASSFCSAPTRRSSARSTPGTVTMYPRTEMLDLVVVNGNARGIITRNLVTGEIERHLADAVCLATGGYGNVFYLSTNAKGSNATAIWRAYKRGALFAQSLLHPDPPHLHPRRRATISRS